MSDVTIKGILLALLVASAFAFSGLYVLADAESTYGVTVQDNSTQYYQEVIDESDNINNNVIQIKSWLSELTSGDLTGFVFAMPTNVARILGLFLDIPNLLQSVILSVTAVFGIPPFLTLIIEIMGAILILLIIAGIWAEGKL